jgi:hypothetical protein
MSDLSNLSDPRQRDPGPIATIPLFDMVADLNERLDFGVGPTGRRVLNGVRRGSFSGPRLQGEVLPGGGDWALFRRDHVMVVDARVTLRTDDGALISMAYSGRAVFPPHLTTKLADIETRHEIDPSQYYFRTTPLFETGAEEYAWLNDVVAIAKGYLVAGGGVGYQVSAVL